MNTVQPGRKQLTHERILDTAAAALRSGGFAGVGVADIMRRAGLTHGGFYAHFGSRDALLAEALRVISGPAAMLNKMDWNFFAMTSFSNPRIGEHITNVKWSDWCRTTDQLRMRGASRLTDRRS